MDHVTNRQRPKSCIACRQSKRKCDRSTPCATCLRYGHRCHYQDTTAATSPTSCYRTAVENPAVNRLPGLSVTPATASGPAALAGEEGRRNRHPRPQGYIAPVKGRFIDKHSSAASPRSLGLELGLDDPPRLHAFAYHLGIRKEPERRVRARMVEFLTWEQTRALVDLYVSVVHPVFGFLEPDDLYRRSHLHWHGESQGMPFEAAIGGVAAMASLFSALLPEETETEISLHAKAILEDPVVSRYPCLDIVSAWILRTLYVRATGRPYAACLCSVVSMNLVEVMGLNQDASTATLAGEENSPSEAQSAETRERVSLTARNLHFLLAYDYGRSIMNVGPMPRSHVQAGSGDFLLQISALADAVSHGLGANDAFDSRTRLDQVLSDLLAASSGHDFVTLAKAELCFAVYRRLRLLDPGPQEAQIRDIMDVGMSAVPAARRLAAQRHPWWNVIHVLFQYICVLLSVNSPKSLSNLGPAMEALEIITQQFHSWLTSEALATARLLIRAAMEKKKREASLLGDIAGVKDQGYMLPSSVVQYSIDNADEGALPDAGNLDIEEFLQQIPGTSLSDWL